jgi:hypothetical protein
MWLFDGGPRSEREIEALVTDLMGPDKVFAGLLETSRSSTAE